MRRSTALVLFAAILGLGLTVLPASPAPATSLPAPVTTRVHELLTRQALADRAQGAIGVSTNCLLTLAAGCAPIPLMYGGGPVEAAGSTNYLIFWEPPGSTVATNYNTTLTQFFNDIGGSTVYGVASQYYQTSGGRNQNITNAATVGGTWVDTRPYPSGQLTDAQIQGEVSKAITTNGWSAGIGHNFFVFLAKGETECTPDGTCSFGSPTGWCAYHGLFASNTLYASMPYAGTDLNGCGIVGGSTTPNNPDTDAEISIASHELMETVTDPDTTNANGWVDPTGYEIGDKCAYTYGPTQPNGSDITMGGHPYIVQEEFSNAALDCAI